MGLGSQAFSTTSFYIFASTWTRRIHHHQHHHRCTSFGGPAWDLVIRVPIPVMPGQRDCLQMDVPQLRRGNGHASVLAATATPILSTSHRAPECLASFRPVDDLVLSDSPQVQGTPSNPGQVLLDLLLAKR